MALLKLSQTRCIDGEERLDVGLWGRLRSLYKALYKMLPGITLEALN